MFWKGARYVLAECLDFIHDESCLVNTQALERRFVVSSVRRGATDDDELGFEEIAVEGCLPSITAKPYHVCQAKL